MTTLGERFKALLAQEDRRNEARARLHALAETLEPGRMVDVESASAPPGGVPFP